MATANVDVYSSEELIAGAEAAFGEKPEVVYAALKVAKLDKATKAQAQGAIKAFKERKV